jgi:hypothetical protein
MALVYHIREQPGTSVHVPSTAGAAAQWRCECKSPEPPTAGGARVEPQVARLRRRFLERKTPEHEVWEGLHDKLGAVLTSPGNLPHLVHVLDSTKSPGGALAPRRTPVPGQCANKHAGCACLLLAACVLACMCTAHHTCRQLQQLVGLARPAGGVLAGQRALALREAPSTVETKGLESKKGSWFVFNCNSAVADRSTGEGSLGAALRTVELVSVNITIPLSTALV